VKVTAKGEEMKTDTWLNETPTVIGQRRVDRWRLFVRLPLLGLECIWKWVGARDGLHESAEMGGLEWCGIGEAVLAMVKASKCEYCLGGRGDLTMRMGKLR
jgi:hypothetical protein